MFCRCWLPPPNTLRLSGDVSIIPECTPAPKPYNAQGAAAPAANDHADSKTLQADHFINNAGQWPLTLMASVFFCFQPGIPAAPGVSVRGPVTMGIIQFICRISSGGVLCGNSASGLAMPVITSQQLPVIGVDPFLLPGVFHHGCTNPPAMALAITSMSCRHGFNHRSGAFFDAAWVYYEAAVGMWRLQLRTLPGLQVCGGIFCGAHHPGFPVVWYYRIIQPSYFFRKLFLYLNPGRLGPWWVSRINDAVF